MFLAGAFSYLLFAGIIPTNERGFYCNDSSIGHPYRPMTVSVSLLLAVCIGVPIFTIDVIELLILWKYSPQISARDPKMCSRKVRRYFSNTTSLISEYLLGFVVVIALMEIVKAAGGRLRPHFLTVCQPNWTGTECELNPGAYVVNAHCTTTDDDRLLQARHSFPSGHSGIATYSWLFLFVYVRHVLSSMVLFDAHSKWSFFRNVLVTVYGVWALTCCVTRVTDFWHHPSDVIAGAGIGLVISWFLFSRADSNIRIVRMV